MSRRNHSKKKKNSSTESIAESVSQFFRFMIRFLVGVYMILILAIMPFYFKIEEGYLSMGSSKYYFFSNVSKSIGEILLPILVCFLVTLTVDLYQKRKQQEQKSHLWSACLQKCSVTDAFAAFYAMSVILSYLCSDYQQNTLWGADSWYMGLVSQLSFVAVYFLISRFWSRKKWMVLMMLPVSAVAFALGYLNRFDVYPIDMKVHNVQFISTIGNINWYCSYGMIMIFWGFCLFWMGNFTEGKAWQKLIMGGYLTLGFATLVTQGSSSGIAALSLMLLVSFVLSADERKKMTALWQAITILSLVCLVTWGIRTLLPGRFNYIETSTELLTNSGLPILMTVVSVIALLLLHFTYQNPAKASSGASNSGKKKLQIGYPDKWMKLIGKILMIVCGGSLLLLVILITVNTRHPGSLGALSASPLFTFGPEWGSMRGATWSAGLRIFAEQNFLHKLFGVGPDGMCAYLYKNGSPELLEMVTEAFGNSPLTNTHNEWLTVLVDTGIAGMVSYVGLMVSAIVRFIKMRKSNVLMGACGFAALAYTLNNMFSFQQAMSTITVFVLLGVGEAFARNTYESDSSSLEMTSRTSIRS